jgi:hypothetical protein
MEQAGYTGKVQATIRATDALGNLLRAIEDSRHAVGKRGAVTGREGDATLCRRTASYTLVATKWDNRSLLWPKLCR